jgi:adenosylcobinamide-GDP ribazoletransferase
MFSAIAFIGSPDAGSMILRSASLFGASLLSVIAGACASAFGIARMYTRKIGGFTGDSLGAAVELGETAALVFFTVILNLSGGLYF